MNEKSCVGCKFLYGELAGYSNYTCEDTEIRCAKDKNPNLPAMEPDDWVETPDNWKATTAARCELYAPGEKVTLDVDGEDGPADHTTDEEAIAVICAHADRLPRGYRNT